MATESEIAAMRRAVTLAARGGATTWPNPVVGAVVLNASGRTIGEGWHERAGGPHAEVRALAAAGARARGGTLVVTLEPCNQHGRTPPCVAVIRASGVRRVVYAIDDPTAAGGGGDALRREGHEVESGVLSGQAEHVNARWLAAVRRGRPLVIWKVAATLDGRVAATDGTSRWISSVSSRADAHRLRATCDTIMVGVGTVLSDDPHLTVRDANGELCGDLRFVQPLRVVVDSAGRTPPAARVRDSAAETWVATAAEVGKQEDGRVDLLALLQALHERGQQAVLLEGGPTLAGAFWRQGLIDRVVAYVAPTLLGGGRPVLADAGVETLEDALALDFLDVRRVGPDLRITAQPLAREA